MNLALQKLLKGNNYCNYFMSVKMQKFNLLFVLNLTVLICLDYNNCWTAKKSESKSKVNKSVIQKYTLEINNNTRNAQTFYYKTGGYETAFDGERKNAADFLSNSKKKLIQKDDHLILNSEEISKKVNPVNFTTNVELKVLPGDPKSITGNDQMILAKGIKNKLNHIPIHQVKEKFAFDKIKIYKLEKNIPDYDAA